MVKNAGSKNKRGRLMKNMKSPNSGLTSITHIAIITYITHITCITYITSTLTVLPTFRDEPILLFLTYFSFWQFFFPSLLRSIFCS